MIPGWWIVVIRSFQTEVVTAVAIDEFGYGWLEKFLHTDDTTCEILPVESCSSTVGVTGCSILLPRHRTRKNIRDHSSTSDDEISHWKYFRLVRK